MKMPTSILLVAMAALIPCAYVQAQTCAAPLVFQSDPFGSNINADVCAASDEVALFCDFLDSAGKADVIWQVEFADGYTASTMTVSGASAGFNPVLYLYSGPCSSGSGCIQSADSGFPMSLVGIPSGTYFLAATAAPSDIAGSCGTVVI